MEDIQTQLDQCKLLLDRAEVGLWEADFVQRGYICSDYLMSIFGKKGNNLSFFEFYYIIREDFRDLITTDFLSIQSVDTYEQIFPIITPTGEKWVRSRLCERKLNNGVCVKALGILQILPNFKLKEEKISKMIDHNEMIFRKLYVNLPVGVELYDRDGYLIDLNAKDMEIFGIRSKKDVLGVNIFSNPILPKDVIKKLKENKSVNFRLNYSFKKVDDYYNTSKVGEMDIVTKASILYDQRGEPSSYLLINLDNTENLNARNEFIFAIAYDRDKTQSYGGTTALINASLGEDANNGIAAALGYPAGTKISRDQWNGYHVPNEYVANFDLVGVDWEATSGFGYNREKSDRRAFFYNIGGVEAYDKANVNSGWRCWKFNSRASDGTLYSTDNYSIFSSADFPMFRLAEMYLIYAEAQARLDGGTTTDSKAMGYIKELRDRAGMTTPSSINLDFILKERACELMWEGHRRTDLIRYGYFTAMSFPWPYKGGIPDGKVALPSYRTVYPLLQSDLSENSNLVQNTGYQSNN